MDRRVLLFVGFQDPKAGNAERESPRGTFLAVPSGAAGRPRFPANPLGLEDVYLLDLNANFYLVNLNN
jgi:hypothetical protein